MQIGFSAMYHDRLYDPENRRRKADKILAILDDHYAGDLGRLTLLDVGCSNGMITQHLGQRFARAFGVDIDAPAVRFAQEHVASAKLHFSVQSALDLALADNSVDVVTCAHIYEHVPNADRLMAEIHRVLKPGGVCFFAAGNRLVLIEGHYRLPLLSVLPKPLADLYLRVLRRGKRYYETHRTLWGLRKLAARFDTIDYTPRVVEDPERFHATDMVRPGSAKQKLARLVLRCGYWACPTYLWLLRKTEQGEA